jgi:hypothetical protein
MTSKTVPYKEIVLMFHPAESVSSNLSQRAAERHAQLSAVAESKRKPARRLSLKLRVKPISVQ